MTRHTQPHGFTLIEVVVASTMIVTISSIGMGVFLHAQATTMNARVRGQMERDAQLIHDSIERDLAYFGVAVPTGCNSDTGIDPSTSSPYVLPLGPNTNTSGMFLRPMLRLGLLHALAFQGDLPFPNSEYTGVASPAEFAKGYDHGPHRVAVASEISGSCVPPNDTPLPSPQCAAATEAYPNANCSSNNNAVSANDQVRHNCDTTKTSLIEATYVPADRCLLYTDASPGPQVAQQKARTCPWGMNKWPATTAPNQVFWTLIDPGGNWYERSNADATIPETNGIDGIWLGIHLSDTVGKPDLLNQLYELTGGGSVAILDRVFWVVEGGGASGQCLPTAAGVAGNCKVTRRQCWGRLAPTDVGFPDFESSAFPNTSSGSYPVNCTPGTGGAPGGGTGWEVIATGVKDVRFRYFGTDTTTPFTATGATLTIDPALTAGQCYNPATLTSTPRAGKKADVRSIEVTVDLERKVPGTTRTVVYSQSRRFLLSSRQST